jgi:hypothetical protein
MNIDDLEDMVMIDSVTTDTNTQDNIRHHKKTKTKHTQHTYKKINATTTNRRKWYVQCNDLDESEQTTIGNNVSTPTHTHITRIALKSTIPATKNANKATLGIFNKFFNEPMASDDKAHIYPWFSWHDKNQSRIKTAADAPKSVSTFRMYANKVFIGDSNKTLTIYPNVRIGHEKPLKDIRRNMRSWLMEGNHGIFYKMLQAESSSEVGWLLYSTRDMDQGALTDEMSDILGFNLGLRWKVIDIGVWGKIPDSQKVHALSVEVEQSHRQDYQRKHLLYDGFRSIFLNQKYYSESNSTLGLRPMT